MANPTLAYRPSSGVTTSIAVFAVIALIPLLLVLINSFKDNADVLANPFSLPTSLSFDNFVTAWTYGQFGQGFVNSILLTATTVIVVLICSSLAGYVLAGQKVKRWPAIMVYLTMAMTVPIQLFIFPLYSAVAALNLTDNVIVVGVIPGRFANFFIEVDDVPDADLAAIRLLAAKYDVEILT